jgi:hypothetical protein
LRPPVILKKLLGWDSHHRMKPPLRVRFPESLAIEATEVRLSIGMIGGTPDHPLRGFTDIPAQVLTPDDFTTTTGPPRPVLVRNTSGAQAKAVKLARNPRPTAARAMFDLTALGVQLSGVGTTARAVETVFFLVGRGASQVVCGSGASGPSHVAVVGVVDGDV